jgi:hypothetical protein
MFMTKIGLLLALALLTGCATGSTIMQGPLVHRDPVPSDDVQLYFSNPPPVVHELAIVTASARGHGQKATDKTIRRLKERAGKIGVNAILLESRGVTHLSRLANRDQGNDHFRACGGCSVKKCLHLLIP